MNKSIAKIIKSKIELIRELGEKRRALRAIRFGEAGARSNNVKASVGLRRQIAVLLSELPMAK
ncbi:MAG: hypothetical protein AAB453_03170 [Patescibacteria group bacterium]